MKQVLHDDKGRKEWHAGYDKSLALFARLCNFLHFAVAFANLLQKVAIEKANRYTLALILALLVKIGRLDKVLKINDK